MRLPPQPSVSFLLALVAIGPCSADPQCKPDLSEKDCSACCAENSSFRNEEVKESCECQKPKVEGYCSSAGHYVACQSCCREANFANGYWDYFNSTCTCLAKKQYIPSEEGLCSHSQQHDECMDCCQDMSYEGFKWDHWRGCECKDKIRDEEKIAASSANSRYFEACTIGCSMFGYKDFSWNFANNLCNCFNREDLHNQHKQLEKELAGECSDTITHDHCMDCCKGSDYSNFYWKDYEGCQCLRKKLDVPDLKSICRVAYDSERCESCCRGTNYKDFMWKSDWNICYCKDYHLPRPKPTKKLIKQQHQVEKIFASVCPEVKHNEGCMQCCNGLSYETSRWDSMQRLCQCSEKQDHKLEPWITYTKVFEIHRPSNDG